MPLNLIPQETKDRWLPLLEGGTLAQTRCFLYRDNDGALPVGYCCLGVYALACGAKFFHREIEPDADDEDGEAYNEEDVTVEVPDYRGNINASELLEQEWANQHGLSHEVQNLLSHLNDGGEMAMNDDSPLYAVAMRYAAAQRKAEYTISSKPGTVFTFTGHSFAEIAKVIREDL